MTRKIPVLMFWRSKEVEQICNDINMRKWWQNFNIWLDNSFIIVVFFCHLKSICFICRCKSGTKIPGTRTSDAVCENGPEKGTENDNLKITTLKKTTIYSAVPSRITTSSRITASSSRITTRSSTGPSKTTTSPSNKNGTIYTSCTLSSLLPDSLIVCNLYLSH